MSVSLLAGAVQRTWDVCVNARHYQVVLDHHTVSGTRSLSVDSVEVRGSEGTNTPFSKTGYIPFSIGEASGTVEIGFDGGFRYTCRFNGEAIPEENALLAPSATTGQLAISVLAYASAADASGGEVTWFVVRTSRRSDGRTTAVHRRFRDLDAMNDSVRAAYKGSHLLSSMPELPPRRVFANRFARDFLDERKDAVQLFLQKMEVVPRVRTNANFLGFLGLMDDCRETSVIFGPGSLGLTMKDAEFVEVSGFKPLDDGSEGPAKTSGMIVVGDRLSKINGESVLGTPYATAISTIKLTPRPVCLHFLGYGAAKELALTAAATAEDASGGGGGGGGGGVFA